MKRIYIASPYTGTPDEMEGRHDSVCAFVATMMNDNQFVVWYSPVANYHTIAKHGSLPTGFEYWSPINFHEIRSSDELQVLCLDGWEDSIGVTAEVRYARRLGIPVKFIDIQNNAYVAYDDLINEAG